MFQRKSICFYKTSYSSLRFSAVFINYSNSFPFTPSPGFGGQRLGGQAHPQKKTQKNIEKKNEKDTKQHKQT